MDYDVDRRQTARLVLRRPNASDRDFVVDLFSRLEVVAHRPHPAPDSREISEQRLLRDMQHWQSHGFGRWAVEHGGRLIGFGGLTHKHGFEGLNISYHLHPEGWGKGYASELVAEDGRGRGRPAPSASPDRTGQSREPSFPPRAKAQRLLFRTGGGARRRPTQLLVLNVTQQKS
jgi:hypothetical protein